MRARIEPHIKKEAEDFLDKLGLPPTQAISLFYRQIILRRGLPFDVVIPNTTTRKAFENTDAGKGIVICKDPDDMFKKLGV